MADPFSTQKRSQIMSRVRSRGNKSTELAFIRLLRRYHIIGWRRRRRLFGNPDFVFPKSRVVVFVDGCFWHSCPKHATEPRSNKSFWRAKLARNKQRDRLVTRTLRQSGWLVVRVWQHELSRINQERCVRRIQDALTAHRRS
jgi:DNA mismatch endonuclease, patch repair protein